MDEVDFFASSAGPDGFTAGDFDNITPNEPSQTPSEVAVLDDIDTAAIFESQPSYSDFPDTSSTQDLRQSTVFPSSNAPSNAEVEITRLREWEIEHDKELEEDRLQEEETRKSLREMSAKFLKTFYEERKLAIEKRKQSNLHEEKEYYEGQETSELAQEKSWERVGSMIDFSNQPTDSRDTSRMKQILLQMKSCSIKTA
eukprot:GHVL01004672.1.p1 GENE.GHVL01004672.1~~GHVL01004672.1.p1  ORF type:complete len:199 (+),score=43.96 GHVL01004672.1:26-622(+)